MDPIGTSSDNTEVEQDIDDRLEKVVQEFNEFMESMSRSGSSVPMDLEELVDLYINNAGQNSCRTASQTQTTPDQQTEVLEDFDEFETMLPSDQVRNARVESKKGFNMYREIQESEIMIKEMAGTDTGGGKRVTNIRYGDLNWDGAASGIIASVFGGYGRRNVSGSLIKFLRNLKGGNESANRSTKEETAKKKSREDIDTEDEVAAGKAKTTGQAHADLLDPASEAGQYQNREQRLKKRVRPKINYLQF